MYFGSSRTVLIFGTLRLTSAYLWLFIHNCILPENWACFGFRRKRVVVIERCVCCVVFAPYQKGSVNFVSFVGSDRAKKGF